MIIVIGVHAAMHAICGGLEQDLALPDARFWWSDYYASADPVSNGPLVSGSGQGHGQTGQAGDRAAAQSMQPGI